VLVVAVKKATKLLPFVTGSDKVYTGKMILGYTSASFDEETELIPSGKDPEIDSIDIKSLIKRFSGLIRQVPPVYSAIKVKGQRAYKIARKGGDLELKSREVTINSIELEKTGENELSFKVDCSKGTYIRSLVSDIGEFLGCGAVMTQLTRQSVGIFSIENSVTLKEIKEDPEKVKKGIVNIEAVLNSLYSLDIDKKSFNHLRNGLDPQILELDLIDGYNYIRYENAPAFILLKNEEGVSYHTFLREEND
jgi:tRNA pseudouridine55 synthase